MWTGWNGLLHECCNSLTQQLLVEVNLSKTYWYSDFFNIWDNVRHINWILFSFIPIHTSVSFKWNCFNELAYIYFKVLNEWGLLPQCAIQMFWIIKNFWSVFKCLRGKKLNIYLSIYRSIYLHRAYNQIWVAPLSFPSNQRLCQIHTLIFLIIHQGHCWLTPCSLRNLLRDTLFPWYLASLFLLIVLGWLILSGPGRRK